MQATEIRYVRRFNLLEFQHEELEMKLTLEPNEMPGDAFKYASQIVELSSCQDNRIKEIINARIEKEYRALVKEGLIK